jgi:hypothetical protein
MLLPLTGQTEGRFSKKKPECCILSVIHDSVTCHTTQMTKHWFKLCGWEVLQNPSHSSDPLPYTSVILDSMNLHRGGDGGLRVLRTSMCALFCGIVTCSCLLLHAMWWQFVPYFQNILHIIEPLRMAYNKCCTVWADMHSTV